MKLSDVLDLADLSVAARLFVSPLAEHPDLPERLAKMSLIFRGKEQKRDARLLAQAARNLAPDDFRIRVLTDWLNRRAAPLWHFKIIHDRLRNEAYARALTHFVKPGMTVFEIGTGTGILAMLAARAGAAHVYTCERRPEVAQAARDIIARNGLAERISVIAKDACAVRLGADIPERADLFVAEIVDNGLLGENVLALTELARAEFLRPDAILIPQRISTVGYLVSGQGHREAYYMDSAMGFDLTPFNRFAPLVISSGKGGGDVEPLSEAVELYGFDLHADAESEGALQVSLTANQSGVAEGVMRWLRLDFGAGILFENRPPQNSSWEPLLHVLPSSRVVRAGDSVDIEISHTRDQIFIS